MRHPPMFFVALALAALACPARGRAEPPSIRQQDAIEDYLSPNFVLPQTSVWRFADVKPYIGGQVLVCGKVNFQSAMQRYLGFHRFYAALDHDRVVLAQIESPVDDPSGRLSEKLDLLCGKA